MTKIADRVRVAQAVYRVLLRLAPRAVRRDYGADMTRTFDGLLRQAAEVGGWRVAGLLAHELRDLAAARRTAMASAVTHHTRRSLTMIGWMKQLSRLDQWRQCVRSLVRRPVFAVTAIVTLALGTGATTALFSIVDTVLIKPLPYPDADRLVTVYESSPSSRSKTSLIAPARLADWRRMSRTLSAISGVYTESVTDTSGADPERLDGRRVLPNYFTVFGASPIVGRAFTPEEEAFNGPGAAVIGEAWWTRRYGRDPGAVGRALVIGGRPYVIVGVMANAFSSTAVDVWLPAQLSPAYDQLRDARFASGVARMAPGVSVEQAQEDLARVQDELAATFPKTDKGWSALVRDLKDARVGDRRQALWLLFGAVALLWVIAIANVSGLVLVHVRRRRRELAIRTAIGASRMRVVALVMQEVLLVSLAGGAIGTAVASWILQLVRTSFPDLPRVAELALDWRALAFGVLASLAAAIGCGLIPALQATRRRSAHAFALGGRQAGGDSHQLQRVLVAGQVALSVLLCTSAALLVRSYYNLTRVAPGFTSEGVTTFHVAARWDEDRARVGQLQQELIAEVERLPGVVAAGLTNFLPATGATLRFQVGVDGLAGPDTNGMMSVGYRLVSAGYLRALQVPVTGESCGELQADMNAPGRVLVNRRFVEKFASGQNLVGRTLRVGQPGGSVQTIVGVAGDIVEDGVGVDASPYVYQCAIAGAWPDPDYVVRSSDMRGTLASLRGLVRRLDANRAVFGVRPLDDVLGRAVVEPRMNASVITTFAAAAMLLAAIGLYGLFTLLVSEGRREMGVRLALGATPRQMVSLVFGGAARLLVAGVVVGLALTAGAERLWRALLFGVGPLDPVTLVAATLTLLAISAVAIAVPAVRASRVAPTEALRGD